MQRRDFVAALTGLALTAPGVVRAQTSGRGCYLGQDNLVRCSVGFSDPPPIPEQPCRELCWATCLAYVLRGFGAVVTTQDVLARHGVTGSCGSHADQARLAASAGIWQDRQGRAFVLSVSALAQIDRYLIDDPRFPGLLDRLERQPVLCGAAGHTTVLTEIHTAEDRFGRVWRERVRVLDPFAPQRGVRDLSEEELARPAFVSGVSIRPL